MVIGAAAMLAAFGASAQAQDAGAAANLKLICNGSDAVATVLDPYYRNGRTPYYSPMMFGEGRQAAQLGVMVANGQVRVKPPKTSEPLFSRSADDGWYELTDVAIDRLTIKGRLKWNRLDRSKLFIDRRNGQVTFGAFTGVCQQDTAAPEATKF